MEKKDKFQAALDKWVNSYRNDKNRLVVDSYVEGNLICSKRDFIDIYAPICYKHKPDWLEADYFINVGWQGDNDNVKMLVLQNSESTVFVSNESIDGFEDIKTLSIDTIPEEMLDEMLAVKDFEPIITMAVPDPTPKEKINPRKEYKKLVWKRRLKDVAFFLSLIAFGISIIALIIKLC